ncbi:IclR family transcriptional regulator [Nocardia sp. JMUB6875]|uniref:IclR family transcriptional regulator n=1 Tax=Nocardia sp. JMUB6875 TaxID=3158170 RepID=UPI0032E6D257
MIPTRVAESDAQKAAGMQTVVRALRILGELGRTRTGVTLQQLSEALDIPLASMHRLLAVMTSEGFVVRSPRNRRYFAGPAALTLSEAAHRESRLCHVPPGPLAQVAAVTGETAFITELIGDKAVCVSLAEGRRPMRLFVRLGQEMPLHAAASARTLLLDFPESEVRALLESTSLDRFTDGTPVTADEVLTHLAAIPTRGGYDMCRDELDRGVWAISAPIRNAHGDVRQSITVAAPELRLRRTETWDRAVRAVLDAARELSQD